MRTRRWWTALAAAAALLLAVPLLPSSCARPSPPTGASERLSLPGLENLGRVRDGVFRGAQPTPEGLDALKRLGIRTVVNLRHYHGDTEERLCRERGLAYERIVLESSDAPSDADVRRFLEIVTDPARQPVYFHCKFGKDRTGTMCACYRMAVDAWPLERALEEMDAFGFNPVWRDLRAYVESFPGRRGGIWPK